MKFSAATTLAALAGVTTASTSILLPLYIYPLPNAWNAVYTAVSANPTVNFQIVVNPDSGPGGAANSYPPSDFAAALSKLNSYPNVLTLGYVHTSYAQQPINAVLQNITTYANWVNYPNSSLNVSVAGIFFDETNNTASTNVYNYMKNVSSYAYSEVPSQVTPVVFNMGVNPASTNTYSLCDTIITYEGYYQSAQYGSYLNQTTINTFPTYYHSQSSVVVHTYTGNQTTLNSLVHNIIRNNIGSVYFTSDCCYNALGLLSNLTAAVKAG